MEALECPLFYTHQPSYESKFSHIRIKDTIVKCSNQLFFFLEARDLRPWKTVFVCRVKHFFHRSIISWLFWIRAENTCGLILFWSMISINETKVSIYQKREDSWGQSKIIIQIQSPCLKKKGNEKNNNKYKVY